MSGSSSPGSGLTRIAQVYSPTEAALTVAALEGAGFQVFVPGYHTHNTVPHMAVAFGGIPVMVRSDQAAEAARFLDALDRPATPDTAPEDAPHLPWWRRLLALVIFLLTGTAPPLKGRFKGPRDG
ncbi:hypothetical protein [Roseovarius pacificus]|uniref:hypothetical protein n=1 Tax=Roseovarius pacificus TaxID=337701 RepID=UPI00403A2738